MELQLKHMAPTSAEEKAKDKTGRITTLDPK
jgi:hypothetical protein